VPLVQKLLGETEVAFGPVNLQSLSTHLHSEDALELVKEHTLSVIGEWTHLTRDFMLELALGQAAEVYLASALFGYALRQADARFRLERLLSPAFGSLKDYAASFEPDEAERAMAINSLEAEAALDRHVQALFGDVRQLHQELLEAIGPEAAEAGAEQAEAALAQAVRRGDVASVRISVGDLRRLVLEGIAFGRLLADAEAQVDAVHKLSPTAHGCCLGSRGSSGAGGVEASAWPLGFQRLGRCSI